MHTPLGHSCLKAKCVGFKFFLFQFLHSSFVNNSNAAYCLFIPQTLLRIGNAAISSFTFILCGSTKCSLCFLVGALLASPSGESLSIYLPKGFSLRRALCLHYLPSEAASLRGQWFNRCQETFSPLILHYLSLSLSIQSRLEMKKRLGCHPFKWYLENVYPELRWGYEGILCNMIGYMMWHNIIISWTLITLNSHLIYSCS